MKKPFVIYPSTLEPGNIKTQAFYWGVPFELCEPRKYSWLTGITIAVGSTGGNSWAPIPNIRDGQLHLPAMPDGEYNLSLEQEIFKQKALAEYKKSSKVAI